MWHAVAPVLAERFTVVVPDLPGYGASEKPPSTDDHAAYSKRGMASTLVHVMRALGFEEWMLAGHDRGARVAYRMALDHPRRVRRLATLDIVPTYSQWESLGWRGSMGAYHWYFLAQPAPLPETLIAADPVFYLRNTLARWAAPGFEFDRAAMSEYERAFSNPETVRACCEDYRAGATIDYELDAADFGKRKNRVPDAGPLGPTPGAAGPRHVVDVARVGDRCSRRSDSERTLPGGGGPDGDGEGVAGVLPVSARYLPCRDRCIPKPGPGA